MTTATTTRWTTRPLGDCGRWVSGGTPRRTEPSYWNGEYPWFSAKSMKCFDLCNAEENVTREGADSGSTLVPPGTILFVVRGMSLAKEFRVGVVDREAALNQDLRGIIPRDDVDARYLARYLRQSPDVLGVVDNASHGTKRIETDRLKSLTVPLPPLSEQKRIADILDKADAIRRKRREARSELASLRQSAFVSLFGSGEDYRTRWDNVPIDSLSPEGTRNGVSPSRRGNVDGHVLVLSAITGGRFDSTAVKEGRFDRELQDTHTVNPNDFLVCRGNGNLELVGAGAFPTAPMPGVAFPDTMIAVRIDRSRVDPDYLEQAWKTRVVRHQVERGARTTNGTHKINQQTLGKIAVPLPPMDLQKRFAAILTTASSADNRMRAANVNELFTSLVQRAFRGGL